MKLLRAEEHLEALRVECSAYLDSRPFEPVSQAQSESDNPWMVWKVNHPPPLRLSILLGDLLHNLRSSLDHIAWQLVLDNGGTPGKSTSFPILPKKKSSPPKIAGGISAKAAALVEELQPYNNTEGAPKEDPLHVLSILNNIDKHREFNIAVLNVSEVIEMHLLTADSKGIYMTLQFPDHVGKDKPITEGAIVARPPFPANENQKWVFGVESRLGLQEARELEHIQSPPLFEMAENLLGYVRDTVVPSFERISD